MTILGSNVSGNGAKARKARRAKGGVYDAAIAGRVRGRAGGANWKERAMIITAIIAVFGKLLVSGRPGT